MKEAGELLGLLATDGFPALYAGGGTTVGGPAVDTEGLWGIGEED